MKGCLKELKRLKKHYEEESIRNGNFIGSASYSQGIADGLDFAIDIIKNKEKYGD